MNSKPKIRALRIAGALGVEVLGFHLDQLEDN